MFLLSRTSRLGLLSASWTTHNVHFTSSKYAFIHILYSLLIIRHLCIQEDLLISDSFLEERKRFISKYDSSMRLWMLDRICTPLFREFVKMVCFKCIGLNYKWIIWYFIYSLFLFTSCGFLVQWRNFFNYNIWFWSRFLDKDFHHNSHFHVVCNTYVEGARYILCRRMSFSYSNMWLKYCMWIHNRPLPCGGVLVL